MAPFCRVLARIAPVTVIVPFLCVAAWAAPAEIEMSWERSLPYDHPQSPVLADIDGDQRQEILLVGLGGTTVALNGEDGRIIWRTEVPGPTLTPGVGVVDPDNSFDLFIPDANGQLHWLDGSTGALIESLDLGSPSSTAPVLWDFDGDDRDEILIVTEEPALLIIRGISDRNQLTIRNRIPLIANSGIPPAVGDVTGDGIAEIAVQNRIGGVDLLTSQGEVISQWAGGIAIVTPLTLVEVTGDGGCEIAYANAQGAIFILSHIEGSLEQYLSVPVAERNTRFGHLSASNQTPTQPATLYMGTGHVARSIDALSGQTQWNIGLVHSPETAPSLAITGAGQRHLIMVDTEGAIHVMDASTGEDSHWAPSGGRSQFSPLVADLDGDGDLDILLITTISEDPRAQMWATDITCATGGAFWISPLGTPVNGGNWIPAIRERFQNQIESFRARVDYNLLQAENSFEAGDSDSARARVEQVLEWNPSNERAQALWHEISRPERTRRNLMVGGALAIALALIALISVNRRRSGAFQRRLDAAREAGRWGEIVNLLGPKVSGQAGDMGNRLRLAEAHIALGRFDADTKPVIEDLAAADPSPDNRWALAQCLLAEGAADDPALKLYHTLIREGRQEPALLGALGNALLKRGDAKQALPYLLKALEIDPQNHQLEKTLCGAMCDAGQRDETFLRIAANQVRTGQATPALCAAICRTAVELHSCDRPGVAIAASQALAADPGESWALVCLGMDHISRGEWSEIAPIVARLPHSGESLQYALPLRAVAAAEGPSEAGDEALRQLAHAVPPPDPRIVRRIAERLAEQGRRDEATEVLCQLATADPECTVVVLETLAECHAQRGQREEQAKVLGRLASLEPNSPKRWEDFGLLCARLRRTDDAACLAYGHLLEKPPADPADQRLLLTACGVAGVRDPRISSMAQRLMSDRPDDAELGIVLIRLLLEQGAAAEAHRRGAGLVGKIAADDLNSTALLARAAFEAKDYDAASALYERLMKAQPDSREWIRNLSISLSRLGRIDAETVALHRRAAEAHPDDPVTHMVLTRALLQAGEIQEGTAEVRRVLQAHTDLGPQVIRLLNGVLDAIPDSQCDPVRTLLIDLLCDQGEFSEAVAQISALSRAEPDVTQTLMSRVEAHAKRAAGNHDALQALGLLHLRRGEIARARETLERAEELAPDDPDTVNLLIECDRAAVRESDTAENRLRLGERCLAAGDAGHALEVLQPIQDDVFLFRPIRLILARAYLEKGMFDLAWQAIKTLTFDDASKPVWYELGSRCLESGKREMARDIWSALYSADISHCDIRERYEALVEDLRINPQVDISPLEPVALSSVGDQMFKERFTLEEEVGVGGMGRVYRATDNTLDDTVALKILPPQLSANEMIVERLKREVRAARQLTHPNIIRIHDFGALGGQRFLSMEYIKGPTLKWLIRTEEKLSAERRLLFARQMAEALAYAHSRGIVHRDIKPANILVAADDQIKVTDFGIAKVMQEDAASSTITDQVVGTPLYMSPEQIRGDSVDQRADIYSYGITLYELLTGHPPFREGDLAYMHLSAQPPPVDGVSPRLARLVERCLKKAPEERPQSFGEILEELRGMDPGDVAFRSTQH